MRDSRPITSPPLIERASPRALFASLLADALGAAPEAPSPMATAYPLGPGVALSPRCETCLLDWRTADE